MPNTIISPNMNLPVPVVGTDPGPDWANNINACLGAIDSHNHSPGQGVQITPAGMNINSDLTFNQNNATSLRSVRFTSQGSPIALPADLDCLYVSGVDLYYNDGAGNQVRITLGGSVTGSAGTITGLPSGTASASYSAGTFTFDKATLTPATMNVGSVIIGQEVASGKGVTIAANGAQAANYNLTLPVALPASTSYMQSDSSGNLSFGTVGYTPLGGVIATFPSLPGAYTTAATTVADANGFVLCVGQTISDVTSPMNGAVIPNLNNANFLQGNTTDSTTGGQNTIPAHTHTFTSTTSVAADNHEHAFEHSHQWLYFKNSSTQHFSMPSVSSGVYSTGSFTDATSPATAIFGPLAAGTGASNTVNPTVGANEDWYTTGPTRDGVTLLSKTPSGPDITTTVSGTTNSTGTGTLCLPPFISTVYIMRIK